MPEISEGEGGIGQQQQLIVRRGWGRPAPTIDGSAQASYGVCFLELRRSRFAPMRISRSPAVTTEPKSCHGPTETCLPLATSPHKNSLWVPLAPSCVAAGQRWDPDLIRASLRWSPQPPSVLAVSPR
eukprot:329848-Rhodomonas_salina.7